MIVTNIVEKRCSLVISFKETEAVLICDATDWEIYKDQNWFISNGYFATYCSKKIYYMHRLIMGTNTPLLVDHVNGNKFDNRRINLRFATKQQNGMNRKIAKNSTTGITGVYERSAGKFDAIIKINGKQIFLGRFQDINTAAYARAEAEIQYFGDFRRQ